MSFILFYILLLSRMLLCNADPHYQRRSKRQPLSLKRFLFLNFSLMRSWSVVLISTSRENLTVQISTCSNTNIVKIRPEQVPGLYPFPLGQKLEWKFIPVPVPDNWSKKIWKFSVLRLIGMTIVGHKNSPTYFKPF